MLEFLLISMCYGVNFQADACSVAGNAYLASRPMIGVYVNHLNHQYIDPLPDNLKLIGGGVATLYKKELKFKLTKFIFVDIREQGKSTVGYEFKF